MDGQIIIDEIGMRSARIGTLVLTAGYRPVYRRAGNHLELAAVQGVAAAFQDGELLLGRRLSSQIPMELRDRARHLALILQAENRDSSDVGDLDLLVNLRDDMQVGCDSTVERLRLADRRMRLLETGMGRLFLGLVATRPPTSGELADFAATCRRFDCGAVLDVPAYAVLRASEAALPRPLIVRLDSRTHHHLVAEPATARLFDRLQAELEAAGIALLMDNIVTTRDLAAALTAGADYFAGDHLGAAQPAGNVLDRRDLPLDPPRYASS